MSKTKSKPVSKVSKDKQIAQLKRELKAAETRAINNARVFAYALDLYSPEPKNILGSQKPRPSNPAQDLLTLAVKISDQHAHCRITVTASPDGTTSVSIEPVTQRTSIEEPEEIEKEKPALDTEYWNQKGQRFSATAYAKDKAGKPRFVGECSAISTETEKEEPDASILHGQGDSVIICGPDAGALEYLRTKAGKDSQPKGPRIVELSGGDEPANESANEPSVRFQSNTGFTYSLAELLFLRNKPQGMTLSEWHTVGLIQRNYLGTKALQKDVHHSITINLNAGDAIERLNESFAVAGFQPVVDAVQAKLDVLNKQPYNRIIPKEIDTAFVNLNAEDAIEKVSEAFAQIAGSESERKAMQSALTKMGVPV